MRDEPGVWQVEDGCSCRGKNLERLIRPALLILLAQGVLNGYKIVQRLAEMPMFNGEGPNASGVYRTLNMMAREGLVTASWDTSTSGPAKRMYEITSKGEQCLAVWMETLADYRNSIGSLLDLGRTTLAQVGQTRRCRASSDDDPIHRESPSS